MNVLVIVAQIERPATRLEALQRHMAGRAHDPTIWWGMAGLLAAALLLWFSLHYSLRLQQYLRNRHHRNAAHLFREVMRDLGLPVADRVVLQRVARGLDLAHPTAILISPTTLRHAAERWSQIATGGPAHGRTRRGDAARLDQICQRIFGESLSPDDADRSGASEPGPDTADEANADAVLAPAHQAGDELAG